MSIRWGGTADDVVLDANGNVVSSRRVRFWTARSGSAPSGSEFTALFSDDTLTTSVGSVLTDSQGRWGAVYTADTVTALYAGAEALVGGVPSAPTTVTELVPRSVLTEAAASGTYVAKIASTTLSAVATTVTFSDIPQTFSSLWVLVHSRSNSATALNEHILRFNGDTATNYQWERLRANAVSASAAEGVGQTSAQFGYAVGGAAPAGNAGAIDLLIPNYASTTFKKAYTAKSSSPEGAATTDQDVWVHSGAWASTAAITSLTIISGQGSFVAGSTFTLYGMP